MNNELNKKLAEWAGFTPMCDREEGTKYIVTWEFPNSKIFGDCPNFTESLDACFKWLVPKLEHYSLWKQGTEHVAEIWSSSKFGRKKNTYSTALALCLAIEELIDTDS